MLTIVTCLQVGHSITDFNGGISSPAVEVVDDADDELPFDSSVSSFIRQDSQNTWRHERTRGVTKRELQEILFQINKCSHISNMYQTIFAYLQILQFLSIPSAPIELHESSNEPDSKSLPLFSNTSLNMLPAKDDERDEALLCSLATLPLQLKSRDIVVLPLLIGSVSISRVSELTSFSTMESTATPVVETEVLIFKGPTALLPPLRMAAGAKICFSVQALRPKSESSVVKLPTSVLVAAAEVPEVMVAFEAMSAEVLVVAGSKVEMAVIVAIGCSSSDAISGVWFDN